MTNFRKMCSIAVITAFIFIFNSGRSFATDWQNVSASLIRSFEGRITSIKQIDSQACRAVLPPETSGDQAVKLAEDIGNFINNYTGGHTGESPVVYVIVKDKEIAVARFSRLRYIGKLQQ
ncbi:MAG: hypothetical protein HY809_06300 [Nitrospirae bacterium]|nr:hypothetical protein [Nitrospirota bacterium]